MVTSPPRERRGKAAKKTEKEEKKEEEEDSEEDFDMLTSPPRTWKAKKTEQEEEEEEEEEEDSDEDEDDWEEVEELTGPLGPVEPPDLVLPSQPVEIEIETPEVRKKKKKQAEFEMYLRRMMNRYKKDLLEDTHKVHLMCLIASGMFRNRLCNEPDLLAITLSLLPTHFGSVAKERIDQNYLSGLLKWFRATFTLNPDLSYEERPDLRALLERRLASPISQKPPRDDSSVPAGPEVPAALLPIGSFFAADSSQTPISLRAKHLLVAQKRAAQAREPPRTAPLSRKFPLVPREQQEGKRPEETEEGRKQRGKKSMRRKRRRL
ncbi:DNA repair protein complementing XP-C cells [Larimichthys crocea]|uniref:Uncharacterized protein n=1 Tax=Larimichthys crocea TaxID=215358 RepID=A0ACD3RC21_LARCR|nr:DNA repair protein complementing XP-C cells [Larimichthys crocea]